MYVKGFVDGFEMGVHVWWGLENTMASVVLVGICFGSKSKRKGFKI